MLIGSVVERNKYKLGLTVEEMGLPVMWNMCFWSLHFTPIYLDTYVVFDKSNLKKKLKLMEKVMIHKDFFIVDKTLKNKDICVSVIQTWQSSKQ
jgi:hypothetical protein